MRINVAELAGEVQNDFRTRSAQLLEMPCLWQRAGQGAGGAGQA
jgi:hypothetical protein